MAMYERRSSMESFDQWRAQSPAGADRRKLSFNPVGEWTPPVVFDEPVAAFEVSKAKRLAQVIIAIFYCLFAAGVVFGFAAIKPVFIAEGVYSNLCTKEEIEDGVYVCYQQELRLNLMFTVAAVSTNVCALPLGTLLDRFGPRVASIVGCFLLILGSLFMAFAWNLRDTFDAYIPGYLFLALGGPCVFIPSFQLSNTFPKYSGLILALLTGAFDTSSALFLVFRLIYQGTDGRFQPKHFFLIYLIVPVLVLIAQIFVMPAQSYKTVGELVQTVDNATAEENDAHDSDDDLDTDEQREQIQTLRREHRESVVSEINALLGSKKGDKQVKQEEKKAARSGVWGALHGQTALQQIATPWFALITLFTVIQMLRINYFVATVRTQYSELLHSGPKAARINEFFDVALPLGGVIAVPFIGAILDRTSTPFVLGTLVFLATAIGAFGMVPQEWAAYVNIALFVVYRPLYYTAVSDYSAKVFGFATFGKVYGLIICLAGLFNFAQAGLDALTHEVFQNSPIPVNLILLSVALLAGIMLVAYVARKAMTLEREKLEEEAEGARETLIPGADGERVNRAHGHETYGTA